jgi:O-antigen/teichoic acid export membrane protein
VLAGGVAALAILQTIPAAVLGGIQRWRPVATVGLATGALSLPVTIAVLAAGGGITGMFAVELTAAAVALTVTSIVARRTLARVAPRPTNSDELRRRTRRYAAIGSFNVVLNFIVWRRSEFLFLKHYSSDTEIALYSIAFAAVAALLRIPEAIGTVIAPAFSTLFGAGAADRMRSGYSRSLRLVLLAALPITAAGLSLGPGLLRLVYGDDYSGTGPVLMVLLSTFPLISLVALSRALIVGLGHQRITVIVGSVAAVLNIGLDLILIPGNGAIGAAVANSIAQLSSGLPLIAYAAWQMRPVRLEVGTLARGALATLLAGGVAAALVGLVGGLLGLVAGALAGGVVLVGLAATLKVLPGDDARWLAGIAGPRLGRAALLAGRRP